jgi:hypothetical protein
MDSRPTRRMDDMGPRRGMDGFARPQRPAGAPQPGARPQPQPRPVAPQRPVPTRPAQPQRPVAPQSYQDPYERQRAPEPRPEARPAAKPPKQRKQRGEGGGGWRVVLQFLVGLLVIAGVAAAIVALYIRYYQ